MSGQKRSGRGGSSAQDVRGAEIILSGRRNRQIFVGGLIASIIATLFRGTLSLG